MFSHSSPDGVVGMHHQQVHASVIYVLACELCIVLSGAAEDAKNKRMRHDTSSGTEYRPEDPQLPSWITERVRPCHVLAHKSSTQPPASAPQTATAQQQLKQRGKQQHKQQVQQQEQQQAKEQQTKGKNIQARPVLTEQPGSAQPKHVLYWMRTAIRGHENPALDVAKHEAKQQGLPLLVAAFVLTSHPYPTARRFKFWLEGLRDAQRELRAQAGASCTARHLLSLVCVA